ncbi:MAG: acetyl-CoA acetyltransferase [Chloroflexi bacterium]|jgi:acetyl-CoA C-acetyltransferase|nr:acetyl-CoA acetyltransferase [Chloroflexota bacterium]
MARRVAIVGTGQFKYKTKHLTVSSPDMYFEVTRRCLDDAGLTAKDIDAVVFGIGPEALDGVVGLDKWCADAAGALNKPLMRINTGGATGGSTALAGLDHVASGMFDVVLVVAGQRMGQATAHSQYTLSLGFDPIVAKQFSINSLPLFAGDALLCMQKYKFDEYHMARIAVKNHLNALNNPYAHLQIKTTVEEALKAKYLAYPLRLLDLCPSSEGACAIILASEDKARKLAKRPAWINGFNARATIINPGLGGIDSTYSWDWITRGAYKMAGIDNPRRQIQVAEPYIPVSYQEIPAYAAFGFCKPEEAAKLVEQGFGEMDGEVPFCPSGGTLCSNTIGASGLARVAEAALQVMGKGEARQVSNVKNALAMAGGGIFGTGGMTAFFVDVFVLGTEPY